MDRRTFSALLLLGAGCATTPKEPEEPKAPTQVLITNRSSLDVATCLTSTSTVPVSNNDTLAGAQYYAYPAINECLANPRNRGPAEESTVVLATSVTTGGVKHEASGTNVTPEGLKCVEEAASRTVKVPPVAKGLRPAKGEMQLVHRKGLASNPFVVFGVNEPSDIVGTIRLASATMCECYAGFTDKAPPAVRAWVRVPRGTQSISEVRWTQRGAPFPEAPKATEATDAGMEQASAPEYPEDFTPEQRTLAECLAPKLTQLQMPTPASFRWDLPYDFEFIHSGSLEPATNATPELALDQLESARVKLQADKTVAYGAWVDAAEQYDVVPKSYSKRDKKAVQRLRTACEPLARASEAWLAKLNAQVALDQRMVELAQAAAARESTLAPLAEQYKTRVAASEKERATAEETHRADVKRCKDI
ncbi:MAG: hypothetical protein L0Y66_03625 [Myxococcaceae bacterium]|nr:hypothetical protein [Myxococcaceae bacterium]